MPKIPDFNELTKKLDLDNLVSSVKSLINPEGGTPQPEEGDKLGELIAQSSMIAQDLAKGHADLAKQLHQLNKNLNQIFTILHPPEDKSKADKAEAKSPADEAKAAEPTQVKETEKPQVKDAPKDDQ